MTSELSLRHSQTDRNSYRYMKGMKELTVSRDTWQAIKILLHFLLSSAENCITSFYVDVFPVILMHHFQNCIFTSPLLFVPAFLTCSCFYLSKYLIIFKEMWVFYFPRKPRTHEACFSRKTTSGSAFLAVLQNTHAVESTVPVAASNLWLRCHSDIVKFCIAVLLW